MDVCGVLWVMMVLGLHRAAWAHETCDQCDCQLSSNEDERAIFSVRSSMCRSGSIDWTSAYGAIRLEIQPYQHTHYRLCFVVHSHHTITLVSQETSQVQQRHNYRLKSSTEVRTAAMIRLVNTESRSEEVCVDGRTGQPVVLFVEVQRSTDFTGIPSVLLQYDVEPLPMVDGALADPMQECRPCTSDELLEAYCTSDFVVMGSIHETRPADDNSDHMHMEVAAAQLIHQNWPVFRRVRRDDRFLYGTVHVPTKCGIRQGKGDFLFTGRMRLGKAKLRCAPYFDDWLKISSLAECVYD